MRYKIRLLAAILAGALAAPVLTGCSLPTGGSASEPKSSAAAGNITSGGEPRPTAPALDFNPLTGLYDMEKGDSFRPLAAMIGNNDRSRPQFGLEKADLYVEAETEGGITRIMAVFANASRVPEQLGPIRSARTPFVLLAQSLDAIYAHCGGSVNGLKAIKERKIQDIEGLIYDGSTYWRDAELRKTKGAEYSMMTSGELLEKRIAAKEYPSETSRGAPYVFGEREGDYAAASLDIYISRLQKISFQYEPEERLYYKFNGTSAEGEPHVMTNGVQLAATNVIAMYDNFYKETDSPVTTYSFTLERGSGSVFTGGRGRPILWTRGDDGLQFQESDGSPLAVAPGKTYVVLIRDSYAANSTFQ